MEKRSQWGRQHKKTTNRIRITSWSRSTRQGGLRETPGLANLSCIPCKTSLSSQGRKAHPQEPTSSAATKTWSLWPLPGCPSALESSEPKLIQTFWLVPHPLVTRCSLFLALFNKHTELISHPPLPPTPEKKKMLKENDHNVNEKSLNWLITKLWWNYRTCYVCYNYWITKHGLNKCSMPGRLVNSWKLNKRQHFSQNHYQNHFPHIYGSY